MLQNLLTALGVAVLSMKTPTIQPTAEPKRAYYDASQVSNYGTETGYIYNYHSATDDYSTSLSSSSSVYYQANVYVNGNIYSTSLTEGQSAQPTESGSLKISVTFSYATNNYTGGFDLYKNGSLVYSLAYQGLTREAPNGFQYQDTYDETAYYWVFNHEVVSYSITNNLQNCTANENNASVYEGNPITLNYTPNEGYNLPSTINVTNAEYTWDASTGSLVINSASGNISVSIEANLPVTLNNGIFEVMGDAATAGAAVIGAGFTGIINLFYNDGITGLGILALIAVGASLVWFAFALILRLWRGRR